MIALLVTGCTTESYEVGRRDQQRNVQECKSKGGIMHHHDCLAVDSIIPLTGPREINEIPVP